MSIPRARVLAWQAGGEGADDFVLVDSRSRDAFAKIHIAGAVNVPLAEAAALVDKLPKGRELVVYCWNHT